MPIAGLPAVTGREPLRRTSRLLPTPGARSGIAAGPREPICPFPTTCGDTALLRCDCSGWINLACLHRGVGASRCCVLLQGGDPPRKRPTPSGKLLHGSALSFDRFCLGDWLLPETCGCMPVLSGDDPQKVLILKLPTGIKGRKKSSDARPCPTWALNDASESVKEACFVLRTCIHSTMYYVRNWQRHACGPPLRRPCDVSAES